LEFGLYHTGLAQNHEDEKNTGLHGTSSRRGQLERTETQMYSPRYYYWLREPLPNRN
jgi:hypothetical protein